MSIPVEVAENIRRAASSSRDAIDRIIFEALVSANIPWRSVSLSEVKRIVVEAGRARRRGVRNTVESARK